MYISVKINLFPCGLKALFCQQNYVRRYFDSSKVRGKGNIYKPGSPEDAGICITILTTTRDFCEIQRSNLLITIICEILLFILICFILG